MLQRRPAAGQEAAGVVAFAFAPATYLRPPSLPPAICQGDELLEKEMERVAAGEPMQVWLQARHACDPRLRAAAHLACLQRVAG